jgi:hypothetical protein
MNSVSTGLISATEQNKPLGSQGVITYAKAVTGTLVIRSGGAAGTQLINLAAGEAYVPMCPVQFKDGSHLTLVAGTCIVHYG